MLYGICMYYADLITLKDICSIASVDNVQTYCLTVAGGYAKRNICLATVGTPSIRKLGALS